MADVLYYYTDAAHFKKIIARPEEFIENAQQFSKDEAVYSNPTYSTDKYYLTDITPQNNTLEQIAEKLYGKTTKAVLKSVEYFVVLLPTKNVQQMDENTRLYVTPESSTNSAKFVMGGRTETYTMKDVDIQIGSRYITVYEKARIIGARALQLSYGAPPLINMQENMDLIQLAELELKTRVLPIGIERKLPTGKIQTVPIQWLADKDFLAQIDVSEDIKHFLEVKDLK